MTISNGEVLADYVELKTSRLGYINPFVHQLEIQEPLDKIKTYILTVFLLPFRVICICLLLILSWLLACIGLYGLTFEELQAKPLTGWRKKIRFATATTMRVLYGAASFNYITQKGVQASPKEAPILVVAPHSSFCDAVVVIKLGPPSVVAKGEAAKLPIFGKLINYTQPIYVWRDDPNSRQNTIKKIIERANSKEDWPQVIVFPEGTCTNRSALITFKPGAFYPGVPVQPVCIRYPNKMDTFTWTWEGPGVLQLLWLTLTKFHNACEIEFLPVYYPTEEEKVNPKLYAKNVRDVMARSLGVPVSEYTYDDCKIMTKAKDLKIPFAADIVEIEKLRRVIGLSQTNIEEDIVKSSLVNNKNCILTVSEFALRLQISADDLNTVRLFRIFDKKNSGKIDFREYLISAIFVIKENSAIIELIKVIAKIYEKNGQLCKKAFQSIIQHAKKISKDECDLIFTSIDRSNSGHIKIADFIDFIQQKPEYDYLLVREELQTKPKIE